MSIVRNLLLLLVFSESNFDFLDFYILYICFLFHYFYSHLHYFIPPTLCFYYYYYYGHAHSIWKFLSQGPNESKLQLQSICLICGNARPFNPLCQADDGISRILNPLCHSRNFNLGLTYCYFL